MPDFPALTVCLSLTVLVLVFAFLRERRLRTGLQCLLSRALSQRRSPAHETTETFADSPRHESVHGMSE